MFNWQHVQNDKAMPLRIQYIYATYYLLPYRHLIRTSSRTHSVRSSTSQDYRHNETKELNCGGKLEVDYRKWVRDIHEEKLKNHQKKWAERIWYQRRARSKEPSWKGEINTENGRKRRYYKKTYAYKMHIDDDRQKKTPTLLHSHYSDHIQTITRISRAILR